MGKKSVSILILFLSIIAVLPTALCAEEDAIYAVMPEDQQVYENDFFLSADDLEYVGAAALESVAVSTDGRYMLCFSDSLTHHVNLYDRACILVRQNNQTTTSNFPCNFNFTVSNMNRFNQGIDHG